MRRRDFLRAAFGAVAGLAVGAPVLPRPRPKNPGLAGTVDHVAAWGRLLTARERVELWNGGAGLSLDCFRDDPRQQLLHELRLRKIVSNLPPRV